MEALRKNSIRTRERGEREARKELLGVHDLAIVRIEIPEHLLAVRIEHISHRPAKRGGETMSCAASQGALDAVHLEHMRGDLALNVPFVAVGREDACESCQRRGIRLGERTIPKQRAEQSRDPRALRIVVKVRSEDVDDTGEGKARTESRRARWRVGDDDHARKAGDGNRNHVAKLLHVSAVECGVREADLLEQRGEVIVELLLVPHHLDGVRNQLDYLCGGPVARS